MSNSPRPRARARCWAWRYPDGTELPGIGLFTNNILQAHLTPAQARTMADRLHDLADQIETTNRNPPGDTE
ncbi:hypothetical protein [Arthrobacter wenxiniae]|uniref:Uncharacterized protein n=1 Tax=Arthrobacter wenxiniae TaxID=2713570 RepID=A0A7Y7LYB4_9MICC|nr:hypothetical protein [Arthrobacter wenxiniae]NVM94762.1 hypothetical protein [Arthrobacter wenxiniae]